ncbi:SMP-30/gluconolactonase/LRE family protein [Ramlibacter sp. USB13]|uniref:SMP-30/gluconolactonase/LRE family protein n=1 Tax=Ramlibacter cellulosilyticus TaxID=2764187 RepID=A0A923SE22_9BURK|nr:SMP-30/gluconolactonase/LRE family protein [Ramlibacter cellulosilyticus]MBC5782502.1 SMP-30/gluconolactonase/LRE family protein [Ramlibacter cellulosilyticus]
MKWEVAVPEPDGTGESPFWHPREQQLYWVDIPGRRVRRWDPSSGREEAWSLPQEPGCIAPAANGGLVLALRDGVYRARAWGATLEPIVRFQHGATTRFNDGKADPVGRFWAGTYYEPKDARKADLYCVDCRPDNGEHGKPIVQLKAHNATSANGLAWSPDQHTLYWSDTAAHAIHAWDWDAGANVMRRHRVFRQFAQKPAGWQPGQAGYEGRPDGAAVDAEGCYWVAMFEGGRVLRLSPGGEVLAVHEVPLRCPTMPCFGGPDGRTLYLTSARQGRPADELAAFPHSGCVLATQVDVPGLPTNSFID